MNDFISVGVFDLDGKELYLNKHWIKSGKNEIQIIVDRVPTIAGIDPYYYLIDKNVDNNLIPIDKLEL